jgi:F0F1-type ATP synthase epsilon subunit
LTSEATPRDARKKPDGDGGTLRLVVGTPQGVVVRVSVASVEIRASDGPVEIRPGAGSRSGALASGVLSYRTQTGRTVAVAVGRGSYRVRNDEVVVTVRHAQVSHSPRRLHRR